MHLIRKQLSIWLVPLFIIISLAGAASLYSQYLLDDEEYKKETEKQEKKENKIPDNIAYNIKATRLPDPAEGKCAIQISWELRPQYTGQYVLARYNEIIDTRDKAKKAQVLQTVEAGTTNTILDTDCTPGSYYYVVISRKSITDDEYALFRDVNLTTTPVVLYSKETQFRVAKIKAVDAGNSNVKITWEQVKKSEILYTVYRSRNVINTPDRLREAQLVKVVPETGEFVDDNIAVSGTYYYAVTAKVMYGSEDTVLVKDENFTSLGVPITIVDRIALKSIVARLAGGAVEIKWDYTGAKGETAYHLVRSNSLFKNTNERTGKETAIDVDLARKTYTDADLKPGSYYYWLQPKSLGDKGSLELAAGINITKDPVVIKTTGKKAVAGDVDRILKRTFFKGLYAECVKELQDLLARTDNQEEAAKARLFIGRSYIEQGQYQTALDYLILNDVKNYFPKEAEFWTEFALTRVRNY
jgi:hypothetical protein